MNKEERLKKDYEFARKCALENVKLLEIYKKRIDKAIEYIENELDWDMPSLEVCDMKIILEILKGEKDE